MMVRIRVVLPAPFGPMIVTTSPLWTSSETSQSACTSPWWATTPWTWSIGAVSGMGAGRLLGVTSAEVGVHHPLVGGDLAWGALGDLLAGVQDDHPVGQAEHRLDQVLHHDDGGAGVADAADQVHRH